MASINNNVFSQITLLPVNTNTPSPSSSSLLNLNNISNLNNINGISNINGGGNVNGNNNNNNAALTAIQLKNNMLTYIANQLENLQHILLKYNNAFTVPVQSFANRISCGNINNQSSLLLNDVQSVINLQNKMWKELLNQRDVADKELANIRNQTINLVNNNNNNNNNSNNNNSQQVILINQNNNIGNIMFENQPAIVLLGNNGNINVNAGNNQQPITFRMNGINNTINTPNQHGIIHINTNNANNRHFNDNRIDNRITRHLQDSVVTNGQNTGNFHKVPNQFAVKTNNGSIRHVDTESNAHIQLKNHFSNTSNSTTTNICNSISNMSNSNSNLSNISSSNLSNISNTNSISTTNSSSISNPFLTNNDNMKRDPLSGINLMINDRTNNDENNVGQQFLNFNKNPDPMLENFNNYKHEQVSIISSEHEDVQCIRKERKERKERRENNDVNNPTNSDRKKRKRRGYNGPYSEEEKKFMKDFNKNQTTQDIIELSIKMENKFKVKRSPYGLAQKMYQMGIINSRLKAIFQRQFQNESKDSDSDSQRDDNEQNNGNAFAANSNDERNSCEQKETDESSINGNNNSSNINQNNGSSIAIKRRPFTSQELKYLNNLITNYNKEQPRKLFWRFIQEFKSWSDTQKSYQKFYHKYWTLTNEKKEKNKRNGGNNNGHGNGNNNNNNNTQQKRKRSISNSTLNQSPMNPPLSKRIKLN